MVDVVAPIHSTNKPSKLSLIRKRLPANREFTAFYIALTVPIHSLALLVYFLYLPSLLLRMNTGEIVAVLGYIFILAVVESLFAAGVISMLCIILPERLFKRHGSAQGTLIAWAIVWGMIPIILKSYFIEWFKGGADYTSLFTWVWFVGTVIVTTVLSILMRRKEWYEQAVNSVVERLSVLAGLYLLLDAMSIVYVIIRNLT